MAAWGDLSTRARRIPFLVLVWAGSFAWFAALAMRVPLDEDEGFYALASELVVHGRFPYRDFFYPQTPLGPLVLAPFAAVSATFVCLRLATAALAAGVAVLVAHAVRRETQSRSAAAVAALLFAAHELTWRWVPTLRPYAFGELCALGAFILATPIGRTPTRRELVLAGALAALAPLARLPMVPTVGIVALAVLLRGRSQLLYRGALVCMFAAFGAAIAKHPVLGALAGTAVATGFAVGGRGALAALGRGAWFALGAAVAVLVVIAPFALTARESLLFGVFDYHALTSQLVGWPRSRPLLVAALGGGSVDELSGMGTQNVLLVLANCVALTLRRAELRVAALTGAAVIAIGSARHDPTIEHYLTPMVPYLTIGAGVAFGSFQRLARGHLQRPRWAVFGGALALFIIATAASFDRTWVHGVMGRWNFAHARPAPTDAILVAVQSTLREHPGPLLAYWPGTCVGSATRMMPGYENQFSRLVAGRMSTAEAAHLHLTSEADLNAEVLMRVPSVVVVDRGVGGSLESFEALLGSSRYAKETVIGTATIYVRAH